MSRSSMGCKNCGCEDKVSAWKVEYISPDGTHYEEPIVTEETIVTGSPSDAHPPLASFNAAAKRTIDRATAVHMQRGNEYRDSWALENVHAPFIRHVLREVFGVANVTAEELRLVMSAALVDVKDSRMGGVFKLDTVDDGINYRAAFASWMEDYTKGVKDEQDDWDEFIQSLDD